MTEERIAELREISNRILRNPPSFQPLWVEAWTVMAECLDEIERLQDDNARFKDGIYKVMAIVEMSGTILQACEDALLGGKEVPS